MNERSERKEENQMTIANILLTLVVLVAAGTAVFYFIKKKKEAPTETKMDVDDKTYTLEKMREFVKRRLDEITKVNLYDIGLSEEELKRRKNKKYECIYINRTPIKCGL